MYCWQEDNNDIIPQKGNMVLYIKIVSALLFWQCSPTSENIAYTSTCVNDTCQVTHHNIVYNSLLLKTTHVSSYRGWLYKL